MNYKMTQPRYDDVFFDGMWALFGEYGTHIWYWKSKLPERKGHQCRVLVRGKMNSILVEFSDGFKVVTSRYAVRKV